MNPVRKLIIGAGLAAATLTGGAVGATLIGTGNAATTSTTAATAAVPSTAKPAHGSADHESQETPVTGDNATKAQAAAVKSVGSGTAGDVTSDLDKGGYEVTVTKADGSKVEVHLDSSFTVMQGHGGHHGGANDNDADDQPATTTPAG
jgi:hypothetical protein